MKQDDCERITEGTGRRLILFSTRVGTQWRRLVLIYRCVFTFPRGLITKPNRMKTRMKRRTRDSSQSGRQSIEEAVENDQFSKSSFGEVVRDLS